MPHDSITVDRGPIPSLARPTIRPEPASDGPSPRTCGTAPASGAPWYRCRPPHQTSRPKPHNQTHSIPSTRSRQQIVPATPFGESCRGHTAACAPCSRTGQRNAYQSQYADLIVIWPSGRCPVVFHWGGRSAPSTLYYIGNPMLIIDRTVRQKRETYEVKNQISRGVDLAAWYFVTDWARNAPSRSQSAISHRRQ